MGQNQEKISLGQLIKTIEDRTAEVHCSGVSASVAPYIVSSYFQKTKKSVVVVVSDTKTAQSLVDDIGFFSQHSKTPVIYFPPYNIMPFKFLSYHNETASKRISALYQIVDQGTCSVIVTTAQGLTQKLIPRRRIADYAELVMEGEDVDVDVLVRKLVAGGYTRSVLVEEPGDFSLRGGILDIFTPLYDDPVRIELFGDFVESIRFFSAASQRTIGHTTEIIILPAREAMLSTGETDRFVGKIRSKAAELELPKTRVRDIVQQIKSQGIFSGMESLTPLIYDHLDTLFEYLPKDFTMICVEPSNIEKEALLFQQKADENHKAACNEKRLCVAPRELFVPWSKTQKNIISRRPVNLKLLPVLSDSREPDKPVHRISIDTYDSDAVADDMSVKGADKGPVYQIINRINKNLTSGVSTVLQANSDLQAGRLEALLEPYEISALKTKGMPDIRKKRGRVYIGCGALSGGFSWPLETLDLITEKQIFGVRKRIRKTKAKDARDKLLAFEDLKLKDLVVHDDHGVGSYEGLVKLKINGSVNDFLLIFYKDRDKLYLPVDRMNLIQKYMGVEGVVPVLDKMGGKAWEKVKEKVKKSAEKIAGELLKLYAKRKVQKGHRFGSALDHFADFEAGFPYEETPDQLKAIEDVLSDMQNEIPMDRLVCGDVGYGKTEVALRASFMAASEARQVAVLAPTTVLAEQHFATFSTRFERFPVNVACLSRFRSRKAQKEIIQGLKNGTVDIVIGTHRLLSKDVAFSDLGLFILDEEQRFGVKQKEKLKKLRTTVDVLALTATPIPRTLHLSLMGIRDISIIATPPELRRSIVTYICEFDEAVIAEAVMREIERGGQVFFVHNHISSIAHMGERIKKLVPHARLAVAHGRMHEDDLEKIMFSFMNKEIDILVCTTIIESGIDVSSANTIIINRADRFGLSQIYQLRGRVGRSEEQAYAYLFIPMESALGTDAQKRLKVLMEHSDLGSGFQIAMSDLKIRGGGAILGASQSGHIAAVGYDMFLKLMEESVAQLKGEPIQENLEPEINLPLSAYVSEDYMTHIDQRLSIYRRLSKMNRVGEISDLKKELTDRFGPVPEEAENLLLKMMLKILSKKAGVKRLDLSQRQLSLYFSEAHQSRPFGIVELINSYKKKYVFGPDHIFKAKMPSAPPRTHLGRVKNILIEIAQHVNC